MRSQYLILWPHQEIHQSSNNQSTTNGIWYKAPRSRDCSLLVPASWNQKKSVTLLSTLIMEAAGSSKTNIYIYIYIFPPDYTASHHKVANFVTDVITSNLNLLSHIYVRIVLTSCLSVCPPACNNSVTTGRIFMQFEVCIFSKICRQNSSYNKIWQKKNRSLTL